MIRSTIIPIPNGKWKSLQIIATPTRYSFSRLSLTLYSLKKLTQQKGSCISGGGAMMNNFGTWERGDGGDTKYGKQTYAHLLSFVLRKNVLISNLVSILVSTAAE